MKKCLIAAVAAILALFMLAGCGGSSSNSAASGSASASAPSASSASSVSSSASASASIGNQSAYVEETLAKARALGRSKQALDLLEEAKSKVSDPRIFDAYEKLYRAQWREVGRTETFPPNEDEPDGRIQIVTHEWSEDGLSDYVRYDMSDLDHSFEVVTYELFEYDANGDRTRIVHYGSDGSGNTFTDDAYSVYDENGKEIRYTFIRDDAGTVYDCEYGYDEHGNMVFRHDLIHDWLYDGFEDIVWYDNENEYDANNNLSKVTRRNQDGEIELISEHEYDEQGNMVKTTNYDSDSNAKGTIEREYDKFRHVTKSVSRNEKGEVTNSVESVYDANGRLVHREDRDADNNIYYSIDYERDENGNIIKAAEFIDPEQISIEYEYTYLPFN